MNEDNQTNMDTPSKHIADINAKLKTILRSSNYCGLCLEENCLLPLGQNYEFTLKEGKLCWSLKEIVAFIFRDVKITPASSYICEQCKDKTINAYMFTQNVIENAAVLERYVDNFQNQVIDLCNTLIPECDYSNTNVLMVLENKPNQSGFCKTAEKETKTVTDSTKRKTDLENKLVIKKFNSNNEPLITKNGYQSTECTTILKTYEHWKNHVKENHKPVCTICFKTFESDKLLIPHYKVHNKVRCKFCYSIVTDTDIMQHLKQDHIELIHSCKECNDVFYNINALQIHSKIVHGNNDSDAKNNKCFLCLKLFDGDSDSSNHQCTYYKCTTCTEMPCIHHRYLISYREQILNHTTIIKCVDCDYICSKRSLLISHANKEHLNYHPYTCDLCEVQYYSKPSLRRHIIDVHQAPYICELCDQIFKEKTDYYDHVRNCVLIKRELESGLCSVSFDALDRLPLHGVLQCDLCSKKFDTEAKLKKHVGRAHRTLRINRSMMTLECAACNKEFVSKEEYLSHMKLHGPNVKFPCKICNIEFENLQKLYVHTRTHFHPKKSRKESKVLKNGKELKCDSASFVCDVCGKGYRYKSLLKTHLNFHSKTVVKCNICNKTIKAHYLKKHLKLHKKKLDRNAKPPIRRFKHKCKQCDFCTFSEENLEAHVNRYHLKVKPHICYICDVAYCSRRQLTVHIKTHSESARLPCPYCDKTFLQKVGLRNHIMSHSGERPHLCDVCGKGFKTASFMRDHRIIHESKIFTCPLCNRKSPALKYLRDHIKKVHWKQNYKLFDHRKVEGLAREHYYIFHDNRKAVVELVDDSE